MNRNTTRTEFHPLTKERWNDFEQLFGPKGASGGCWCMLWRTSRTEHEKNKGEGNREAMRGLVNSGRAPGVIGYVYGTPAAWCSVAPREEFPSLARSRILKPVDDQPVWSISCFFIAKEFRGEGLAVETLKAAVEFATEQGATIVEGYPVEPSKRPYPTVYAWVGFASIFMAAGFEECARRSETRPIMRYYAGGT